MKAKTSEPKTTPSSIASGSKSRKATPKIEPPENQAKNKILCKRSSLTERAKTLTTITERRE